MAPVMSCRKVLILSVVTAVLGGALPAGAGATGASDALLPAIDKVVRILDDPALKGEARTIERRAALHRVLETAVDFPEAARRALAANWRARTDAEREEFTALFKGLVTYSYIRVMESYGGETVQIVGESQTDDVTTVLTRIQRRQGEPVPVGYRMHLLGSRWLIYDVLVDGVSLVGNYRVQFNTIIHTASYTELVRRMRVRLAELHQAPAASIRALPPRG